MRLKGLGRVVAEEPAEADHAGRAVSATGDDARAVGREGHAPDLAVMPLEGLGRGLAVEHPQPDGAVSATGDDARPLARDGPAPNRPLRPLARVGRGLPLAAPHPRRAAAAT